MKPVRAPPAGCAVPACFDLAIVGAGMIGSAAARHASHFGSASVALIGPCERARAEWSSQTIFSAHYDEGRITRATDPDPTWAELAARSIARYDEIAAESGISFFCEVGHLAVATRGSEAIANRLRNAQRQGVAHEHLHDAALERRFPYLHFPAGCEAIWEASRSGYISARRLVAAQIEAARRHGCMRYEQEVCAVERKDGGFNVRLADGIVIKAALVLVATGSFTNSRPLLPPESEGFVDRCSVDGGDSLKLDFTVTTTQTVHFVLEPEDARRLAEMPSVIFKGDSTWFYMLPPIEYPDGSLRIKLGGASSTSSNGKRVLADPEAITHWYRQGGDDVDAAEMEQILHEAVPGLKPTTIRNDACACCKTPSGQAYIGEVADGLFVATGGNGLAAKSSDEIGRLGALATLSADGWPACESFARETFVPRLVRTTEHQGAPTPPIGS